MTVRFGIGRRAIWGATALLPAFALTSVASAADLESPSAATVVAPSLYSPVRVQNWSGFSVGVFGGGGRGEASQTYTDNTFSTGKYAVTGAVAGVRAGLDYQSGNWVWGQAADFQWSAISAGVSRTPPGGISSTFSN